MDMRSFKDTSGKEMEANQTAEKSRILFFKRLRRALFKLSSSKLVRRNKDAKPSHSTFKSIHRQYTNTTLKQYPCTAEQRLSPSEICSKGSGISNPALEYVFDFVKPNRANLDTLPEYIILHLFQYLDAQDISSLGWCSRNLYTVARGEKKLWRNVDHVCDSSSPHHRLWQPFLNDFTTALRISKPENSSSDLVKRERVCCFEHNFFKSLKNLSNLKSFTLENHSVDHRLNLRCLPQCLTELRLRRLNLLEQNGTSCLGFHNVHLNLPNLEVVDVSHCSWVTSRTLYSLSQCPKLQKLELVGCTEIDFNDLSLHKATIYGFWKIETLDLRLTRVTFEDVSIFKKLTKLKEVLLEKQTPKQDAKSKKKSKKGSGYLWKKSPENISSSCTATETITLSNYVSSRLHTLVVRNYPEITDSVLDEIRLYFGSLKYLDVIGTNCTFDTIVKLQDLCPGLKLLY